MDIECVVLGFDVGEHSQHGGVTLIKSDGCGGGDDGGAGVEVFGALRKPADKGEYAFVGDGAVFGGGTSLQLTRVAAERFCCKICSRATVCAEPAEQLQQSADPSGERDAFIVPVFVPNGAFRERYQVVYQDIGDKVAAGVCIRKRLGKTGKERGDVAEEALVGIARAEIFQHI